MSGSIKPVPLEVSESVRRFISAGRDNAKRYGNVKFALGADSVWDLHRLVADVYSKGFADGWSVGTSEAKSTGEVQP